MATELKGLLPVDLESLVRDSKVLVVGAGGIGCELLKNLVLTGFKQIHIIDLDTIDVSNLNRQFLFRREHVGQSKALVAKESALQFNPSVDITAYHDSITEQKYDLNFYKQFSLVMNALDNRGARSHVNRMCLAGSIPLIESGSAGYKGSVSLHKKGVSECYDCTTRPHQKTFPGCTIRNTPSEPIHCIVWAKHLFNQLFGVADPDEDVSPDSADPEAVGGAGKAALDGATNGNGNGVSDESVVVRAHVSTRQWAHDVNYDPKKLFHKLFSEDIKYLLSMENLWLKRRKPTPLCWDSLPDAVATCSRTSLTARIGLKDQRVWSVSECAQIFQESCAALNTRLQKGDDEALIWDKDDDPAMDFVTACSNIRSHIFGIQQKSRFDVKSMAGNIIPAIPSTNAIVAGLVVMSAFNVLRQQYHKCSTLYVNSQVNPVSVKKVLFAVDPIVAPNPKCFVCAEKPEIVVKIDLSRMTCRMLGERVLKGELNMVAPDVELDDGQGTLLISSEEGETEDIADKLLKDFNVGDGSRLKCDDFLQNYQLVLEVLEMKTKTKTEEGEEVPALDREKAGELFEVIGDRSHLGPKEDKEVKVNGQNTETELMDQDQQPGPSHSNKNGGEMMTVDDDDDLLILDPEDECVVVAQEEGMSSKTKRSSSPPTIPSKKRKIEPEEVKKDEEIEIVDLD